MSAGAFNFLAVDTDGIFLLYFRHEGAPTGLL